MTEPSKLSKFITPIAVAICIATISSTAAMLYRHDIKLVEQQRDISKLRARVYRERIRVFEFHERYFRAVIQVIQLQENKEGLSVVDKSRLNFYISQKELVQEERDNYIETWKHEGQ